MARNTTKTAAATESTGSKAAESEEKNTGAKSTKVTAPRVKKQIDPHTLFDVTNGFYGKLTYIDRKTGEHYDWDEFGATIQVELEVIQRAKVSQKRFFTDNWWMFNDQELIDYLNVGQYYSRALSVENFDSVFEQTPAQIAKTITGLSQNQKNGVKYRAKQLIEAEELNDLKVIRALEEALGTELILRE